MIIAIVGQKGGSGKTTIATNIAAEWVERGQRVLLVDADPQGSVRTWGEVAGQGNHPVPTIVAMGASMHRPDQLPALSVAYDLVVIDSPPRHGDIQRSALMIADMVILPCGPSAMDVWALAESLEELERAQQIRPELKGAIIITRKISRTAIGSNARNALMESQVPLLKTELGFRVAYQEAPAAGMGVTRYETRGTAASEIRELVDELELCAKKRELHNVAA
jgi:chromosome partitioning protein